MMATSQSRSSDILELAVWDLMLPELMLSSEDVSHVIKNGDDWSVAIMCHEPGHS